MKITIDFNEVWLIFVSRDIIFFKWYKLNLWTAGSNLK